MLGLVLIVATAATSCHHHTQTEQTSQPKIDAERISFPTDSLQLRALTVEPVEPPVSASGQLAGRLTWNEDITLRVFTPFAGRVRKSLVQIGQTVEKGEPLAEIESPDFGQAQADARKAESDLQLTKRNLERLQELFAKGAVAEKELDAAKADAERAESERARSASRLSAYGANADTLNGIFILRSAIGGTIVEKNVNPGQEVRPDQMLANVPQITAPLFVISDPSNLWIQIDATELDISHLQPGHEFAFSSRAFPGENFTGSVEVVSQFIDPVTRTIKVRGSVNNVSGLLKAEMFVTVNLPDAASASVTVPSKAVLLKGDKHYVFVEDEPGHFSRHEVKIGSEQDDRVFVLSGLDSTHRIVTNGSILLQQLLD
jgi:cobalt-zinc-cadmium efflux system membrane fusion protein